MSAAKAAGAARKSLEELAIELQTASALLADLRMALLSAEIAGARNEMEAGSQLPAGSASSSTGE